MGDKKEQKIVVFIAFAPSDKALILNGIRVASIFRKELCLVYRTGSSKASAKENFKQKLLDYLLPINQEIPNLKTSSLILRSGYPEAPEILAEDYEAILLIAGSTQFKKFSKAVTESAVPFLFVNPDAPVSTFKNIVLPIDLRRETGDASLWSSWFGRFNESHVTVIAANDKNKESRNQIARNIDFIKKLYLQFKVAHKLFRGQKSSLRNSFEALDFAVSERADLLIVLGSSVITPLDWLIGLPERKIVKKSGDIPVLLVNPRRDNYILCD